MFLPVFYFSFLILLFSSLEKSRIVNSLYLTQREALKKKTMNIELATDAMGASILNASSFDSNKPPQMIIDGRLDTFWSSTGVFPQDVILQLGESSAIKSFEMMATGLRKIELYKTDGLHASSWELVHSVEADDADGEIQRLSLKIPARLTATFFRVKILSGWTDIITIHKISVVGSPSSGGQSAVKK